MPDYIGYSPWQDAAQVGRGIGDALATMLFKIPLLRAEMKHKERDFELEERRLNQQQEYNVGRLENQSEMLDLRRMLGESQAGLNSMRAMLLPYETQSRINLNQDRGNLYNTQASLMPQNVESQVGARTAMNEWLKQRGDFLPRDFGLREDQENRERVQSEYEMGLAPYKADTARARVNLDRELLGLPPLPGAAPTPPRLMPRQRLESTNEELGDYVTTDSPPARPSENFLRDPSKSARVLVRNEKTGQLGWATELSDIKPPWKRVNTQ